MLLRGDVETAKLAAIWTAQRERSQDDPPHQETMFFSRVYQRAI